MKTRNKIVTKNQTTKLSSLINNIDWIEMRNSRGSATPLIDNGILVGFYPSNGKNSEKIDEVKVRIGKDVVETLGWKYGDLILPLLNPDDHLNFLLVKTDSGGYKLAKDDSSCHYKINFRYRGKVFLTKTSFKDVNFEVYKNQLIFRVD